MPDIPLIASTELLDIHADEEVMLCAGGVAEYQNAWRYTHAELGVGDPLAIRAFVVRSVRGYCGKGARGCRLADGTIVSAVGSVHHELGHASNCEWRNSSAPALSEGLATSFELTPLVNKTDPREFITAESRYGLEYSAAGHFVRWLLEERGVERFRDAYEHAPRGGGEEVLEVLAAAYEQPADELFDEYMATAPDLWVPHRQCADLELLEPEAGAWEFQATFDCADPSTLGPYERPGSFYVGVIHSYRTAMYQSFLIEVETPGMYRFERDEIETGIEIERCVARAGLTEDEAEELWHHDTLFPTLQATTDVELRTGTYRVDILREHAEPHPVWVRIAPNPG